VIDEVQDALQIETASTQVVDRVTARLWELDLSVASKVHSPKRRPTKRRRQNIVQFIGREGTIERFAIRQTIPYCGYEVACPPSQLQYGAVCDFFIEGCETRFQAHTLLSARDYGEIVASEFPFTGLRKRLVWLSATAFILSDKDLRSRVRSWSCLGWSRGSSGRSGIVYHKPYKLVASFAAKLIDDMRSQGAEIFG
jgi:hypothetical protein